ncbi:MAG: AAA family ATPase, partial [Verrucomicrobia bacterium]|nr:AAA family ATPase [Verrucomicrobiota bacterium]
MADPLQENKSFDFRVYLGMLLFRWQTIAVCFLFSLLIGVLFLQFTPKKYITRAAVRATSDPTLDLKIKNPWTTIGRHARMLEGGEARNQAIEKLAPEWGETLGDIRKMYLPLDIKTISRATLWINIKSETPRYAEALLREIQAIHQRMWQEARESGSGSASSQLSTELDAIEERIRAAESEVFEFERLNDMRRIAARAGQEDSYISELVSSRRGIQTQLWMMEVQFPALRNADVGVMESASAYGLNVDGKLVLNLNEVVNATAAEGSQALPALSVAGDAKPPPTGTPSEPAGGTSLAERGLGWHGLRYDLIVNEAKEREMAKSLKDDHPSLKAVRQQIAGLQEKLRMAAELQFRGMMDRYRGLQITHDALEAAEYKWQAINWQRAQKMAELGRLQARVTRYEENYRVLYERLNDLRMNDEMKIERVTVGVPTSSSKPVWPDPTQVLLIALGVGLGLGVGISLIAQFLDNKVQSIKDVEGSLGIPFLGGVPFWVHSGLEKAIRPIVTEEHSVGAVEAYRALRTSIVAALEKAGEKVLIVTSADSREGKTLTALNTAIMMAQMHRRVLLVDMDLHRGRLHRSLGLEKEPGVTNVLRGERSLRSIIVPTRFENLSFAPPGPPVDDAPELLQSSGMQNFFTDVQDEYDYIICDSSPVLR